MSVVERKAACVVGRLSMMAAIVVLAPVDGLMLSVSWREVHVVLGSESSDGVEVERVWGSMYDCCSLVTLPGLLLGLGYCRASGLYVRWCAYQQLSPRAHPGK